jgi:hypothetical protein
VIVACAAPSGYVGGTGDCDDAASTVNPGADEICDGTGVDEDCDGLVDDDDPSVDPSSATVGYVDVDGDGYGDVGAPPVRACELPLGYVDTATDCDDSSAAIHPGGAEVCDAVDADEDCDGLADNDDPGAAGGTAWYPDADGDAYGAPTASTLWCDAQVGWAASNTDCDDANGAVNPGETEVCSDGVDNDCDLLGCRLSGELGVEDYDAKIYGDDSYDEFGYAIAGGVDVDADGYDDLVVGAPSDDYSASYDGSAFLYDGPITLGASTASAEDYAYLYGTDTSYALGDDAWGLPDVNGDGYDEIVLGRSDYVYLVFGAPSGTNATGAVVDWSATCQSISTAGHFDTATGDRDFLCGYSDSNSYTGVVTVYAGSASPLGIASLVGESVSDYAGTSVGGGGDVDGDGLDDVWVGASGDDDVAADAGAAYLVYAPVSGTFALSAAEAKIRGTTAGDWLGRGVLVPGDTNLDGYDDALVGAPNADDTGVNAGNLYLFEDVTAGTYDAISASAVVRGGAGHYVGFDNRMSTGDVDGDGEIDLLVGGHLDDTAAADAGATWLLYGPLVGTIDLATDYDLRILGEDASDFTGYYAAVAGDLSGDGYDDLAIGGRASDERGYIDTGAVFVFHGLGL